MALTTCREAVAKVCAAHCFKLARRPCCCWRGRNKQDSWCRFTPGLHWSRAALVQRERAYPFLALRRGVGACEVLGDDAHELGVGLASNVEALRLNLCGLRCNC